MRSPYDKPAGATLRQIESAPDGRHFALPGLLAYSRTYLTTPTSKDLAMPHRRSAYFVSDRTGITAESLGNALLTQFDMLEFKRETIPFIDTADKAMAVAEQIRQRAQSDHFRPLVFVSIVNPFVREAIQVDDCAMVIDFFHAFVGQLENELEQKATLTVGKSHGIISEEKYDTRIEAVNFSLNHDDGVKLKDLANYSSELLTITPEEESLGYKYVFQTKLTKDTVNERLRGPMGLWSNQETFIDNNMQLVLNRLHEYYA